MPAVVKLLAALLSKSVMKANFLLSFIVTIIFSGCVDKTPPPLSPATKAANSMADPQLRSVLDELNALQPLPIETLSVEDAREQPSMADAMKSYIRRKNITLTALELADIDDRTLTLNDKSVPARIYTPLGDGPFPVLVYAHGGGWVIANLKTYDASCRALSKMADAIVISVDYRKAPEYKFPAAHEDVYTALQWAFANAESINGDPNRVAVGGESAGGNMAGAVALMAKERNSKLPVHQLLIYPVTDNNTDTISYREFAEAQPLSRAMMLWFFEKYMKNTSDNNNKYLFPLKASQAELEHLPPATVITAQIDPLRSEGRMYADRLASAGNEVEYKNFDGVTHDFFGTGEVVDTALEAEMFAAASLRKAFSKNKTIKPQ